VPTASPWQRPLPPTQCDVAVVGGGIMGAATAYWLRCLDPSLHVVLVEAEALAHGASGRNAGFVLPGTHNVYAVAVEAYGREAARQFWQLTAENLRLLRDELEGAAFDLRLTGSHLVAGSEAEAERLRASAVLLSEDGVAAEFLGTEAACARLHAEGFHGALFVGEGGTVHPAKLVRYLAARSGATVFEGWPVQGWSPEAGGVRLAGPMGQLDAGCVVFTVNAWLPHLWPEAARFVRPVRAQMLATAPVAPFLDGPVYSHEGFYYLRQMPDGRLFLGGARHRHLDAEVGYDDLTTDAVQRDLEAYLDTHFPLVGERKIERRWSGTMGFSPDGLPVVGALPDAPGSVFAAGFTGHGMALSVRFGLLLARLALGHDEEAAALFDPARFDDAP